MLTPSDFSFLSALRASIAEITSPSCALTRTKGRRASGIHNQNV
jgi:hypothetical protein